MRTLRCCTCHSVFELAPKEAVYLEDDGLFICGATCLVQWLIKDEGRLNPLNLNGDNRTVRAARLDRPEEVYSNILGRFFRSHFEMHFAEVMASWGMVFTYETLAFVWDSTKFYAPDFYFPQHRAFVELKGRWRSGQRKKFKLFREAFPEVAITVVPWILAGDFRIRASQLEGRLPPLV
jgi:hypothetical protein